MIGQTLGGRYQIIKQLSKGGFGVTFVAADTGRPGNPECIVKLFKPAFADPRTLRIAREKFEKEAEKLEKLGHHDQIPRLLACFQENQDFYLVQEYIEGRDLTKEIVAGTQLNEAYVIQILQDILEVLSFVHKQNLIHRDIKPSNIRRRKSDGKIFLLDFGAVKEVTSQLINTQRQISLTIPIGTIGYMPSEQARGQPTFSSDIYALGIIAIQALTGINPNPQRGGGLPIDSQTGEIAWRDRTNVKVSPKLANIIDKMVRYDYRQRYQTGEEALQAIKAISRKHLPWKIWLGAIVVTVFTSLFSPFIMSFFDSSSIGEINFVSYENSESNIQIKYPDTWIKQEIGDFGEVAKFFPSSQQKYTYCPLEIVVNVNDLPEQLLSLNEYKNFAIQKIQNNFPGITVDENQNIGITLASFNAYILNYTRQESQCRLQSMEIGTVRNGKAYFITYTADVKNYSQFKSIAEQMIKSFKIKNIPVRSQVDNLLRQT